MKVTYGLSVICGRRPELLERTLASFRRNVFCNFDFNRVVVNIDPFCGKVEDEKTIKDMIISEFKDAIIRTPDLPSFGAAVKWAWSQTISDVILHIEDDWLSMEPIFPHDIDNLIIGDIMQAPLVCQEKNLHNDNIFQVCKKRRRFLGIPISRKMNCFSTSPCFMAGDFAKKCSNLMNPDLDPEKQFYSGLNIELESFASKYKSKYLHGKQGYVISDIGREWRNNQGIVKNIVNGTSTWNNINV